MTLPIERRGKALFIECDTCRAKLGHPTLCEGCLHNRRAIGFLRQEYLDLKHRLESLHDSTLADDFWMAGYDREKS